MEKKINIFCGIMIVLAIISLVSRKFFGNEIGVYATTGKIIDGIYYLMNTKGDRLEVSRIIWYLVYIFEILTIVFVFAGMLSVGYFWTRYLCIPVWKQSFKKLFDL